MTYDICSPRMNKDLKFMEVFKKSNKISTTFLVKKLL